MKEHGGSRRTWRPPPSWPNKPSAARDRACRVTEHFRVWLAGAGEKGRKRSLDEKAGGNFSGRWEGRAVGKLLIVDDDEALRRLMRLELSDSHEIVDSGEPEQGLALALEHMPDAILLDLRMPKYSGYELLQTFTSLNRTQSIPVIVVSGEGGSQTKEHCQQLGAAALFEKPIDFDALRKCLNKFSQARQHIPRTEVRVRLRVQLKLRGTDKHGVEFEESAATENVSLSGFLCSCPAELSPDSVVQVFLTAAGTEYVGKAKIIHADSKSKQLYRYGCRFIEKQGPWVLG